MSGEHAFEFEVVPATPPIKKVAPEIIWVRSKDKVKLTNLLETTTQVPAIPGSNNNNSTTTGLITNFGSSLAATANANGRQANEHWPFAHQVQQPVRFSMSTQEVPTTPSKIVTPAASSVLQGNREWKLEGNICINIEGESIFHINLSLSWSIRKDTVKLTAGLTECPANRGKYVYLPNQVEEIVLFVKLLGGSEKPVETKCIKIPKTLPGGLTGVNTFVDSSECFFTVETLRRICQVSPEGANPSVGTTKAFEYVQLEVETGIQFNKETTRFWKSSSCTIKDFLRKKISLNVSTEPAGGPPNLSQAEVVSSMSTSVTLEDKTKSKKRSKFSEIITLLVGPDLEKVVVYKDALVEQSPVFEKMFETDMQEKNTGQVELRNHSVETVDAFLTFLYCTDHVTEFSTNPQLLLKVLALAHEKEMTRILHLTIRNLVSVTDEKLNLQIVLEMFNAGQLYSIADLKFRAIQWIRKNKEEFWTPDAEAQVGLFMSDHKEVAASLIGELLTLVKP